MKVILASAALLIGCGAALALHASAQTPAEDGGDVDLAKKLSNPDLAHDPAARPLTGHAHR